MLCPLIRKAMKSYKSTDWVPKSHHLRTHLPTIIIYHSIKWAQNTSLDRSILLILSHCTPSQAYSASIKTGHKQWAELSWYHFICMSFLTEFLFEGDRKILSFSLQMFWKCSHSRRNGFQYSAFDHCITAQLQEYAIHSYCYSRHWLMSYWKVKRNSPCSINDTGLCFNKL
jgi:hypothetical protein